jgi:DNA-binding NarL/FixJ family response regulator
MPKILIADDNESLRTALKDVLSTHADWIVCGEATNGRSAVSMAAELKPDLIVLDFLMPLLNGIAAAAEIVKITPHVPIVLYTMHMSGQLDREAKKVGISKVVSKTEPFEIFVASLEEFLGGKNAAVGPIAVSNDYSSTLEAPVELAGDPNIKPRKKPDGDTSL